MINQNILFHIRDSKQKGGRPELIRILTNQLKTNRIDKINVYKRLIHQN
jgi:hypothetical protein